MKSLIVITFIVCAGCLGRGPNEGLDYFGLCSDYGWDSDQDGMPNEEEHHRDTDPCDTDTDNDGANDFQEVYELFSDPLDKDTDNDGWEDGSDPSPINAMGDWDEDQIPDIDDIDPWIDVKYHLTVNWSLKFRGDDDGFGWSLETSGYVLSAENFGDGVNRSSSTIKTFNWPDDQSLLPFYLNLSMQIQYVQNVSHPHFVYNIYNSEYDWSIRVNSV